MDQIFVIFFMQTVARCVFGLTCNDCFGSSCTQPTCDSGSSDCQTTRIITAASETVMHSCSETSSCQPLLFNTSASLTAITCCDTDRCNDGTNTPLEPNTAYCYSASCYGEGCIPGMVDYIEANDIGTYCAASEDGCQTSMTMTTSPVSGEQVLQVTTGCASTACVPLVHLTEGNFVKSFCCKDRLCNNGGETSIDANKEYCYSYSCVSSTTCLSVTDAAAQGNVAYCEKPSDGCFLSRVVTSDSTTLTAGCVGQSELTSNCTAVYASLDDLETTSICCNSDKCNNGEVTLSPNKKYCYVYGCISAPCTPIAEAIRLGKISYCEQSENKGCMTSSIISSDGTIISTGCVGITAGMDTCTKTSSSFGGMEINISCCTSSFCNGGEVTLSPNKKYCYVYSCISAPCTPIAEAIRLGKISYCEQSENNGCMTNSITSSDGTIISIGCVGVTQGMDTCTETSSSFGGMEVNISCCTSSFCNGGISPGTEQPTDTTPVPSVSSAEPSISSTEQSISSTEQSISSTEQSISSTEHSAYCHVYTCASTSGSCTSLSDAIIGGKTTKCQKSDKGCFAMKTDDTLSAGCVGETSDMMECKNKPPDGGTEIICCNTGGCNSRFTSAGRPLFSPGVVFVVLLVSVFLQLFQNIQH